MKEERPQRPLFLTLLGIGSLLAFLGYLVMLLIAIKSDFEEKWKSKKGFFAFPDFTECLFQLIICPILFYCFWFPGKWKRRLMIGFYLMNSGIGFLGGVIAFLKNLKVMGVQFFLGMVISGVLVWYLAFNENCKKWYLQ